MTPELAPPDSVEPDRSSVHRFLDTIDDLVRRHRALAAHDGGDDLLHTELIATELSQQIATMRRFPRQAG